MGYGLRFFDHLPELGAFRLHAGDYQRFGSNQIGLCRDYLRLDGSELHREPQGITCWRSRVRYPALFADDSRRHQAFGCRLFCSIFRQSYRPKNSCKSHGKRNDVRVRYGLRVGCSRCRRAMRGRVYPYMVRKLPFHVQCVSKPSNFFDVKCDDGPVSSLAFGLTTTDEDDYHHYIVNPARVFDTFLANRRLYIAIPNALQIRNDVERVGVTSYDLRISRDCSGVYLRWIDRQGQYEYYLFHRTAHEYAISKDESFSRNEMSNPAQYVDGVNIGTSTRQIIRQAETLTIVAPLIDDPTYDYLSDLAQSPGGRSVHRLRR